MGRRCQRRSSLDLFSVVTKRSVYSIILFITNVTMDIVQSSILAFVTNAEVLDDASLRFNGTVRTFERIAFLVTTRVDEVCVPVVVRKVYFDRLHRRGLMSTISAELRRKPSINASTVYPKITLDEVKAVIDVIRWRRNVARMLSEKWKIAMKRRRSHMSLWEYITSHHPAIRMIDQWFTVCLDDRQTLTEMRWMVQHVREESKGEMAVLVCNALREI